MYPNKSCLSYVELELKLKKYILLSTVTEGEGVLEESHCMDTQYVIALQIKLLFYYIFHLCGVFE